MKPEKAGFPFLVLGVAFLAIGATGRSTFLGMGLAFFVAGVYFLLRARRDANR